MTSSLRMVLVSLMLLRLGLGYWCLELVRTFWVWAGGCVNIEVMFEAMKGGSDLLSVLLSWYYCA